MIRPSAVAALGAVLLPACSAMPDWAVLHREPHPVMQASAGDYHFDWQMSGERRIAPLQVFDDGDRTWLQLLPGQIAPAVFGHDGSGERLLSYRREGDYLVVDGVWSKLTFRGGHLTASARKKVMSRPRIRVPATDSHGRTMNSEPLVLAVSTPDVQEATLAPTASGADSSGPVITTQDAPNLADVGARTMAVPEATGGAGSAERLTADPMTADTSILMPGVSEPLYGVRLRDRTLREALQRWAALAHWTFAPEHWAIDVDIAISGESVFPGSFQDAVQDLLAATELADHPLRPCFYSNRVLRVVPYAQACDRASRGQAS